MIAARINHRRLAVPFPNTLHVAAVAAAAVMRHITPICGRVRVRYSRARVHGRCLSRSNTELTHTHTLKRTHPF